jgi:hypothetical protein
MKRKYFPTEYIDQQLRQLYGKRLANGRKAVPSLTEFGQRIDWPKFALTNRARQLGLARTKEKPWSEAELTLVERYAHLTDATIQRKLKSAGYQRTRTAIKIKLTRKSFRLGTEHFSATGFARLMGIDSHCVTRWIGLGYLKAEKRGTNRTEKQGGDDWLISPKAVRNFLLSYPNEYDLRKVTDQMWFLDAVTDGKIAGNYLSR